MAESVSGVFKVNAAFVIAQGLPMMPEDIQYGLSHDFLSPGDAVDIAAHEIECGTEDEILIDLGSLLRDELGHVPETLEALGDPLRIYDPRESTRKWLYLQLQAAYDERATLSDPLGAVESIYADFEYPKPVAPFVRYMPLRPGDEPGAITRTRSASWWPGKQRGAVHEWRKGARAIRRYR